jgi:hypothetical protein
MTITDDKKEKDQILINIESTSKEEEEDHDEDPEELEQITHNLRDELTEIDTVEKVDLVTKEGEEGKAPEGSKAGGEVVALGSLLVTLGTSAVSTAIPNLSNALQSWLTRHERRKISLEVGGDKIEVIGISDEQQQQLIESWLSRHSSSKDQKKGSTTDGA